MRLHLLQGIILYHQNNREGALEMLRKAEEEIKVLKVDEDSLMMLVELGMSIEKQKEIIFTLLKTITHEFLTQFVFNNICYLNKIY